MSIQRWKRMFALLPLLAIVASFMPIQSTAVRAANTPTPSAVTIAGSLQSEIGCGGDWDPGCATTRLSYDAADDVWQGSFDVSSGSYEYKAALNNGWDENYGKNAAPNGANIALNSAGGSIKFYYDHKSHWITDNKSSVIATMPGSFQSELGCAGDWDPGCLRSWLQDIDGDGIYTFETTALPVGSYEGKAAINESWDENYGQGGAPGGANIAFTVPANGTKVTFSFNSTTKVPTINVQSATAQPDNNVEWDGLLHDSRDTLYRTPSGAVPAGTSVTIRFRTFSNDVTGVALRLYDLNANGQRFVPMTLAATNVPCSPGATDSKTCDFWAATIKETQPNNFWYRFVVTDGTDTDYYGDNTAALDGGLGATSDDPVDQSYALMFYDPKFTAPDWARNAVIYQIFPDRFRNGRANNDPKTGDVRYDDPVLKLPWGTLPEGYCRNYTDATTTSCPWRFGDPPPSGVGQKETPRGRDYMGGDLKGVEQQLDYLKALGVNTIYFNPIFDAGSNHGYDTQDYYKIDPYFGTQKDWENLVKRADQLGMRIVLDGVFNHMSSDSPFFDRYGHYSTVGACESVQSKYRNWFVFQDVAPGTGTCVGSDGTKNGATYTGWFGFDSIPVLNKTNPEVQKYFLTSNNSVSKYWLNEGAAGWRLDVMGDASFPNGYWETFRNVVKTTDDDALIIGELWQKDSTLLRYLRGDRADTTMNYRLRDAVLGLLTPGAFDSKGFGDSGRSISATEFVNRIASIREDYPDAAFYSLMNLMGSHDTERVLWTLTPGPETQANKEQNAANVANGKQRQQLASLIQFTMPGAPTIYYGDEVGLTGDDDPDDRRTYPWADLGGKPDTTLLSHYSKLAKIRAGLPSLTGGDLRMLLADDAKESVAYGRKTTSQASLVVINRSNSVQTVTIPVAGYLPNGARLSAVYGVNNQAGASYTVNDGKLSVTLQPLSGLLLASGKIDLQPTAAPRNLAVSSEGNGTVALAWKSVQGASGYNVYRSFVTGGGYVKVNEAPLTATTFTDSGLRNATSYFYVVKALDSAGNESAASNEVNAMPRYTIAWSNLQWPPSIDHTISVTNRTPEIFGQVYIEGVTNAPGATAGLRAQLGFGPDGSDPKTAAWTWIDAAFNTDAGNNDEFKASLLPEQVGTFDYTYRYSTTNGRDWLYADLDGSSNGYSAAQAGSLNVTSSGDTTAPAVPSGLRVVSASPAGISLAWNAVSGDASMYGYEVRRANAGSSAYTTLALVTDTSYTDTSVASGASYSYVVRAVDQSFNRSENSAAVTATAELRTVTLKFTVTVPAGTDATNRSVYIAGFLDRLDGGLPQWDPAGVKLTRQDATTWTITLTGKETTQIEYKYALGSWDYVEKDANCGEIGNRQLTLSYGSNGVQQVNDTIGNWRNVAPCGN